jgi:hypothetical protein
MNSLQNLHSNVSKYYNCWYNYLPIKDIAEKGRPKGLDVDMDGACPGMNGITEHLKTCSKCGIMVRM